MLGWRMKNAIGSWSRASFLLRVRERRASFPQPTRVDGAREQGGGPAVTLQYPSDLPLDVLVVPGSAGCSLFGQFDQLVFQSDHEAVEDGVLVLLSTGGPAQDNGLFRSLR